VVTKKKKNSTLSPSAHSLEQGGYPEEIGARENAPGKRFQAINWLQGGGREGCSWQTRITEFLYEKGGGKLGVGKV